LDRPKPGKTLVRTIEMVINKHKNADRDLFLYFV